MLTITKRVATKGMGDWQVFWFGTATDKNAAREQILREYPTAVASVGSLGTVFMEVTDDPEVDIEFVLIAKRS